MFVYQNRTCNFTHVQCVHMLYFKNVHMFDPLNFRSFFQSICVLGYCVLPLAVGAIIVKMCSLFGLKKGLLAFIVDFVVVSLAFVWAMFGELIIIKLLPFYIFTVFSETRTK